MTKPRKPRVEYSDEIAQEILDRISSGETLTSICNDERMPYRMTVERWRHSVDGFGDRYKQARDQGFDVLAEGCIEIADDGTNDYMMGKDGPEFNSENVQRSKLRVWTRLELLKRWDPARYGDLIKQQHSGGLTLESLVAGSVQRADVGK